MIYFFVNFVCKFDFFGCNKEEDFFFIFFGLLSIVKCCILLFYGYGGLLFFLAFDISVCIFIEFVYLSYGVSYFEKLC